MKNRFECSPTVGKWDIWEASFNAPSLQIANPFIDADITGEFIAPSGKIIGTRGFYDGNSTWKLRFCPEEEGKYHAKLSFKSCSEKVYEENCEFTSKSSGNRGKLQVIREYPHFLQTEDGTPFYVFGSGMEAPIPNSEKAVCEIDYYFPEDKDPFDRWKEYLDMLEESGFNRLRFFIAWNSFPQEEDAYKGKACGFFKYRDKFGKDQETGKYDMARFNITYFQLVDRILMYAMKKGIYAEVTIFDRCCLESWEGTYRWKYNTYNEKNGGPLPEMEDIAECWGGASTAHLRPDQKYNGKRAFFDIAEPHGSREDWVYQMWNLYYQRLYVDYVLARTSAFSNIYYEIINEIERPINRWTDYWFDYLKEKDPYHHLKTISPIYAKKEESARKKFLHYHIHNQNSIISLHNDMLTEDAAEINPFYWELRKPIVYDEVFWIHEKVAAYEPALEVSYDDERKWFWSSFVNGSMTVRVCWQAFRRTPAFAWLRHLRAFIGEFRWWKMEPFTGRFSITMDETGKEDTRCFECRIDNNYLIYLVSKDGKLINDVKITRKDELVKPQKVRYFNTQTGKWSKEIPVSEDMKEMVIHFTEGMEDAALVIYCDKGENGQ